MEGLRAGARSEAGAREVLLGLGSNQGDRDAHLRAAVEGLGAVLEDLRVSSVYRTEPVGHREQPDFHNLVVRGRSALPPEALLAATSALEARLGRTRAFRNAPRTIDVDLLAVGDVVMETPALTLPHPRLHERAFVLVPLAEVAPGWRHPVLGLSAAGLLARLRRPERVEALGPLDLPG